MACSEGSGQLSGVQGMLGARGRVGLALGLSLGGGIRVDTGQKASKGTGA